MRVNPDNATSEGETARRAVVWEAGVSPVEKQSP